MGSDGVLDLAALGQPLGHQLGRDLPLETGGVRSDLLTEGEETDPVELGLHQPLEEPVVVGLGFPGVADDERRPEGGGRLGRPDRRHSVEESVTVAPPAHALQQRARNMLQREVEVGNPGGQDGIDQPVVQCRWIEVEQASPSHAGGHGLHQVDDGSSTRTDRPVQGMGRPTTGSVEAE